MSRLLLPDKLNGQIGRPCIIGRLVKLSNTPCGQVKCSQGHNFINKAHSLDSLIQLICHSVGTLYLGNQFHILNSLVKYALLMATRVGLEPTYSGI